MISDELRLLVPNQRGAQTKNPCAAGRLEPGAVKPDMGFYVYSTSEPKPLFKPVASNGPTNQTAPMNSTPTVPHCPSLTEVARSAAPYTGLCPRIGGGVR